MNKIDFEKVTVLERKAFHGSQISFKNDLFFVILLSVNKNFDENENEDKES